jgi:hypothetical protein
VSRSGNTLSRKELDRRAPAAESGVWWAEVADLRERIERRRAQEWAARRRVAALSERRAAGSAAPPRRTITITGHAADPPAAVPLRLVEDAPASPAVAARGTTRDDVGTPQWPSPARRRPRRTPAEWLGSKPDRIAAWAVALGFLLVLAGILSAH